MSQSRPWKRAGSTSIRVSSTNRIESIWPLLAVPTVPRKGAVWWSKTVWAVPPVPIPPRRIWRVKSVAKGSPGAMSFRVTVAVPLTRESPAAPA